MRFTAAQVQRLRSLGCEAGEGADYGSAAEREAAFKGLERQAVGRCRDALKAAREQGEPVIVNDLAAEASGFLRERRFLEVSTPIIIPGGFIERMGMGEGHPLRDQVFWVDGKSCLRPMLAPGLYNVSRRLLGILGRPLGVFEVGPCFRRESQGPRHLECFTMLNFVEWGVPEGEKRERARQLTEGLMGRLGLSFEVVEEDSAVYGRTFDVVAGGTELASGAFGPHPLDAAWGMTGTWLGLGVGLERAACLKAGIDSVQRVGRSFLYRNGIGLNFK